MLIGLAPLGASSAETAGTDGADVATASSAAMIELVPVDLAPPTATPVAAPEIAATSIGRGSASYYASKFHGRRTASGEPFDNRAMTAAHRTLPFGSLVRVTHPGTGASVVVRINDRGPFTRGRAIDVSRAAAEELGLIAPGHAVVEMELITS